MYLVILLYSLFASVFTAAKLGLEHAQPFFLVGSRMTCAGLILMSWVFFRNRSQFGLAGNNWIKLLLLGLFNIYLTNGLEFWGMQYLTSSKTSFIYSLSPFLAALFSYFCFKEILSKKKWLGLFFGFAGFIPILLGQSSEELKLWEFGFISLAEASVMGAAASTVYGWIIMRQLVDKGLSPLTANGVSMTIGGILALCHSLATESWSPIPVFGEISQFWKSTAWMIVASSLICYNLYGYLLRKYTVTFMSFSGFMTPFITAFFGWIVIGETISMNFIISAFIVFFGLLLFYQEELKKEGILNKN